MKNIQKNNSIQKLNDIKLSKEKMDYLFFPEIKSKKFSKTSNIMVNNK